MCSLLHMIKSYVPRFHYFNVFHLKRKAWNGVVSDYERTYGGHNREIKSGYLNYPMYSPCEPKGGLDFCSDQQNPISSVSV